MNDLEEGKFSPKEILDVIKELDTKIELLCNESNLNKTRVLFLGPTGCGKTTLMHLLCNCQMTAQDVKPNIKKVLCCDGKCKAKEMIIGHRCIAETRIPTIIEEDDYLLCDCPGFLDNRSLSQRILNSYSIKKLLSPPCKIKILLFLNQYHFLQDRIVSALNLFDEAEQFFEDYYQFEECVGLVVTKVEPDVTIQKLLDSLDSDEIVNHRLFSFFKSHPERCFQVSQPSSGLNNIFNCKDKILNFLKKGSVSNPKHKTIIDTKTIQQLCILCDQMNEKLNEYLVQFSNDLAKKYRDETEIDKLTNWIETIKQLRIAAAQGINKFYDIISQHEEFADTAETFQLFFVWNLFYEQIVSNSSAVSSKKYLFKCQMLTQIFDDQLNELQVRRDHIEKNDQLLRDKNASMITQQLEQYIKSGGVHPTHAVPFFTLLKEHPFHYFPEVFLKRLKPINVEIVNQEDIYFDLKINNDGVKLLLSQMEELIEYCLSTFKIINEDEVIMSILSRLRNTDQCCDNMEEFKKFVPNKKNKTKGVFENLAHPLNFITAIPVGFGFVIGPLLKKKRDIRNMQKMEQWFFDGTLARKIQMYEFCIAPMMKRYQQISKIHQQNFSISCTFGGYTYNLCPFEKIAPILPNESHVFLISQCLSMTNLIKNANSKNSMEVFNGVYSLYHKVTGEIVNLKIDISGNKLYQMASRGEKIDNVLSQLSNDLSKYADGLNDKIVLYSQILATTRMLGAINGRGIGSHERKKLFGLLTVVNSQDESGNVMVYSRQNIQDINNSIISHVQDLIYTVESPSDDAFDKITPESFVKTARAFKKKIEDEYQGSQNAIFDSILSIVSSLNSTASNHQSDRQNREGAHLLKDLEKVEGVTVENKTKNDAKINFNGSIIKVILGNLIGLAPQIKNAVVASKKCHSLRKKIKKINSYDPLIRFYQRTANSIKNPLFQGVILAIDKEGIISIDDIVLNQ